MKNVVYFVLKAFFILKIFKLLSRHFCHVGKKQFDWKDKVNFKIHDVTTWFTNNFSTHIGNQAISIYDQKVKTKT